MARYVSRVLIIGLIILNSSHCSGCEQRIVQSAVTGDMEIAVVQRVCGGASGYSISIAPPGMDTSGVADDYEPFFVGCDCYDLTSLTPAPVTFTLQPDNVIIVSYRPDSTWTVTKKLSKQGRFRLIYQVIPGENQSPKPAAV